MGIKRTPLFAALAATLLIPSLVAMPSVASATQPQSGTDTVVLASGLQGTYGGTIGPDGALYVTEATVGDVKRIDTRTGQVSTFASGLPPAVIGLGGAVDIAFIGRTAYVLVTLVGPDVGGNNTNGIYRVDDADSFTVIADLGEWSRTHPPATSFEIPSGLQFALETARGGFLVTDGHHNRVLSVTRDGVISQLIAFDNIVPTGLDVRGNTVYMAEAGPIPHLPATGKVVSFGLKNPTARTVASGFSLLVDVEFGRCDALYALSQGDSPGNVPAGSPALPNSGELLRTNANGTFSIVVDGLNLPTSVDFVKDTAFVVANGQVLKVSNVSSDQHKRGNGCGESGHHYKS
ncbi:MAG: hypothetical protein JWM70_117 [Microbacteriaceae bacterium]|nr:hypothetical protein [Microbacteriaceae bacterium]